MKKFKIDSEIFELYPELMVGVIHARGIDNTQNNSKVGDLLTEAQKQIDLPSPITLSEKISCWRDAYKKFGAKPKKFPSSIEALCRRVSKGNRLPEINTLVDLYNAISVKYILPVGAEDLDKTSGDVVLSRASGEESCIVWGDKEEKNCELGEVFYGDDIGPICRRFNWREVERACIEDETKNAILVIECLDDDFLADFNKALIELETLTQEYTGAETTVSILDIENMEINL